MGHLVKLAEKNNATDYAILNENLKTLTEESENVEKCQNILRSLRFPSIKVRHDLIKPAHAETFGWVFRNTSSTFNKWLLSGDGIYWIQGKAGSGKSTLMRFMSEHPECQSVLAEWAGDATLHTGSYFFWNAGNSMQKSQRGLLQTLLYQVLKEVPELIEQVCPQIWKQQDGQEDGIYWTRDELFAAFERLPTIALASTKFCFFVDGLDEYSGNHQDLVHLIEELSKLPSIKLCVSSRPWNVFQNSFGQNDGSQLKLEDLTRDDIKSYVHKHLQLRSSERGYQQILMDIVDRAQGVFLWVSLVVDSLLKGLSNNDSILDMQRRLDEFPSTLEKYFKHMIENIEPFYREDTIQFFELAVNSLQQLPLLAFKFLQDEKDKNYSAVDAAVRPFSVAEIDNFVKTMKLRLNARCGDLLEVRQDTGEDLYAFKYKVHFLHRTVRDFFLKTDTINELRLEGSGFDVRLSLCRVMIALLKVLPIDLKNKSETWKHMFSLSDEFMHHARGIEVHCDESDEKSKMEEASLLEELDRINTTHFRLTPIHWSNFRQVPKGDFAEYNKKTFLATAIQAKLTLYVREVLETSDITAKSGRPLLDYALRPNMAISIELPNSDAKPDFGMVCALVEKGADVNKKVYIYGNKTVWNLFLEQCYNGGVQSSPVPSEEDSMEFFSIVEHLIQRGADPNITFVVKGRTIGITEAISAFLSRRDSNAVQQLLEQKCRKGFNIWKLVGWN